MAEARSGLRCRLQSRQVTSPVLIAVTVGAIFAPLGGLCAAIITYAEYSTHRLPEGRALREALRSAMLATLVLFALTGVSGWLMGRS